MKRKKKENTSRFINRDISWLAFNARVLEEARDSGNPLLERLKFISIFSSNLDEFFMVRIAGMARHDPERPQKIYKNQVYYPGELLATLNTTIRRLVQKQYRTLNTQLLPELEKEGIQIVKWQDLTAELRDNGRNIFLNEISPVLTPIGIDPTHPFPQIPNLKLELLIRLKQKKQQRFAVIQVPSNVPRFLRLDKEPGAGGTFIASEDLIAHNLDEMFNGYDIVECTPFRITRDMDLSIDETTVADLMTEMQNALQARPKRSVVRLEVTDKISAVSSQWLMTMLDIKEPQLFRIKGILNLKSMMELSELSGFPELKDLPMPPVPSPVCPEHISMFEAIRRKGAFILHHPYESFDPVLRLLNEAADDPKVLAIKQTLYRVSSNSPVVAALERAARNGKQVTVLFEIKARFDEENNMRGAMALADAGAHVVYGIAKLKVHCKALLIVRKEENGIRRYVHLSTGNYNEKTARQYTDIGYFSDNAKLAQDTAALFNVITGFSDPPVWNQLIVAPYTLKDKILFLIDREARLATKNNPGHIRIKVNSLIDYEIIEHLYKAAENNVRIEIVVRGICGINPYALSPAGKRNFRIVSILDRYLEHARIYYFRNNGAEEYFIGSADMMPRNLRRRIELLLPVTDPVIREDLDYILKTQLHDQRKGRIMTGVNLFSSTEKLTDADAKRSQSALYEFYRERHKQENDPEKMKKGRLTVFELKTKESDHEEI
ncbi:MAG: polyphosphate kinase 1 [Lentisphaeria bacterium]|nr:polyphosphate kinase 1 [Lentisphaeria bacterium]